MASKMAPVAVNPHATTLLSPKGASEAGSKNTPEPIELPTTNATHIQKLRSWGLGGVIGVVNAGTKGLHLTLTRAKHLHSTLSQGSRALTCAVMRSRPTALRDVCLENTPTAPMNGKHRCRAGVWKGLGEGAYK